MVDDLDEIFSKWPLCPLYGHFQDANIPFPSHLFENTGQRKCFVRNTQKLKQCTSESSELRNRSSSTDFFSLCESEEIFAKVTRAADVLGNVQAFLGIHGEVNYLFDC